MGHGGWVLLCGDGCGRQSSKRELEGEGMGFMFIWLCIGGGKLDGGAGAEGGTVAWFVVRTSLGGHRGPLHQNCTPGAD